MISNTTRNIIAFVLGLIGIIGACLLGAYVSSKRNQPIDNSAEQMLLKINAQKDSVIAARMLERETFLQYIDSLKGGDTTIYNYQTKIIKQYQNETDRIVHLPDTGQLSLVSKNISKLKERKATGHLLLRR
jgi:hypothetical protein